VAPSGREAWVPVPFSPIGKFFRPLFKKGTIPPYPVSHNHRLSRWLAQPYKGILPAGLKAHGDV